MKASTLFGLPRLNAASHYPDLRPLRGAVVNQDWPAVAGFFAALPEQHDPSVAAAMVADLHDVQDFLQRAAAGPASPTLAATLLGARWVRMAWDIRSGRVASMVSRARMSRFHVLLAQADRLLAEVTADEPDNIAAWTVRVRINRGLQLGLAEARRRYDRAAKARPDPLSAQLTMLQQLCPKWGGSLSAMHAFAKECHEQSPPGSLNGAVVAEAHIEHARTEDSQAAHMSRPEVREQLRRAVAHSVGHPNFQPVHGWVQAHSSFAYAWCLAGESASAAPHFAALGNRVTTFPWVYVPGTARAMYKIRQVSSFLMAV